MKRPSGTADRCTTRLLIIASESCVDELSRGRKEWPNELRAQAEHGSGLAADNRRDGLTLFRDHLIS